jgi:DNA-binding response OmpR family regulator
MADLCAEIQNVTSETKEPLRILLVEDNVHFATTLRNNLEIEGFVVDLATSVVEGRRLARTRRPALVILDIMLPGRSGYELLNELRTEGIDVPLLVLTARRDEEDKLRGFGMGADDFVTKPVSLLELLARIRALLRRARPGFEQMMMSRWITFGEVEVQPATRTVRCRGALVNLRPKEFDLLVALMRRPDRIVSRAELLRDVWGYNADAVSRTIDTHIAVLRHKLERDPLYPEYLVTVRAAGYMLKSKALRRAPGAGSTH